eukprot:scaffold21120_cov28-Tisochrysis_lutea.AAC.3
MGARLGANNGTAALGLGQARASCPSLPQLKQVVALHCGNAGGRGSGVRRRREYFGVGSSAASWPLTSPAQSMENAWQ